MQRIIYQMCIIPCNLISDSVYYMYRTARTAHAGATAPRRRRGKGKVMEIAIKVTKEQAETVKKIIEEELARIGRARDKLKTKAMKDALQQAKAEIGKIWNAIDDGIYEGTKQPTDCATCRGNKDGTCGVYNKSVEEIKEAVQNAKGQMYCYDHSDYIMDEDELPY